MKNISRVASLIQTYIASFIGILCLGIFGGIISARFGLNECLSQAENFDWYSLIWLGLGLFLSSFVIRDIIFPKIKGEIWKSENVAEIYGNSDFCSSHPSYVLLDILLLPPFYLIYSMTANDTRCTFLQEHTRGQIMLFLAIILPIFRLSSWYILQRQIRDKILAKNASKSLKTFYLIILPIFVILAVLYVQMFTLPQMRAPVANSKTFAGGLSKHPEFTDKIVRLQGIQNSEPFECNKFNGEFACATVLVDLNEGGEVLVKICGAEQQDLVKQTQGKIGKPFETFGEIILFDAKQKDLCGIETLGNPPLAGRYLLEVEYP